MMIKKFLHSCILVEENGKKLLFDPGAFCFIEKKIRPEDIGTVDVIILTHKHLDHYYTEALKTFFNLNKDTKLIANRETGELLKQEGLKHETINAMDKKDIEGFSIEAFEAPHGEIPGALAHNLAYFVNNKFLHPGDSFYVKGLSNCKILALPLAGPWATQMAALNFAKKLKAKKVIPIHDAIIKDFSLERLYMFSAQDLEKSKISFHPLKLDEILEV